MGISHFTPYFELGEVNKQSPNVSANQLGIKGINMPHLSRERRPRGKIGVECVECV